MKTNRSRINRVAATLAGITLIVAIPATVSAYSAAGSAAAQPAAVTTSARQADLGVSTHTAIMQALDRNLAAVTLTLYDRGQLPPSSTSGSPSYIALPGWLCKLVPILCPPVPEPYPIDLLNAMQAVPAIKKLGLNGSLATAAKEFPAAAQQEQNTPAADQQAVAAIAQQLVSAPSVAVAETRMKSMMHEFPQYASGLKTGIALAQAGAKTIYNASWIRTQYTHSGGPTPPEASIDWWRVLAADVIGGLLGGPASIGASAANVLDQLL